MSPAPTSKKDGEEEDDCREGEDDDKEVLVLRRMVLSVLLLASNKRVKFDQKKYIYKITLQKTYFWKKNSKACKNCYM